MAAALVGAAACGPSRPVEGASGPELARVERRDLEIRVEATGQVEPIRVVEVKSRASGEILRVHVETGDEVPAGALLVEIDPRDVRNALAQAEADLEVARAQDATAEAQRARTEELRRAKVITQQDYENAALAAANAKAQLVKARTNLELARERTGDVTIRAPIAGTVIQKSAEVGQIIASASTNVSGGTTLLLMADLSEMQVRTLVDETDIGRIAPGQPARVTVEPYPDRPFRGRVLKIEPQAVVEQNVTMFPVLVRLGNEERLLKPGMSAEVDIEVAHRPDVVVVPNAAVVSPREAPAAGAVLGLSEADVRSVLRAAGAGSGSPRPQAPGTRGGGSRPPERTGDSLAEETGSVRAAPGGRTGPPEEGGSVRSPVGGPSGSAQTPPGRRPSPGQTRPAVVFLAEPDGPKPRLVLLGLNDWDYTEVVRGLEPGQRVVLMSVARLQQQQQEFSERVRQRTGNPFSGDGGGRPGQPGAGGSRP